MMSLAELRSLRGADTTSAINQLENTCYSSALFVLKDSKNGLDAGLRTCVQQLIDYRQAYARPQTQWSVVEHELAKRLTIFLQNEGSSHER